MTVLFTEEKTLGDWLALSDFPREITNETVGVKAGQSLASGAVVGKVTATGLYAAYAAGASDGTQTVAGVMAGGVAATATQATLTTGTPASNAIVWAATEFGDVGNDISIAYVDPGENSQSLSVEMTGDQFVGYEVVVNLATDGSGDILSTPALIVAAVAANAEIAAVVTGTADGASAVAAVAATNLTGGDGYASDNEGVIMNKLTGCLIKMSGLTYTGTAATVAAGLVALGARIAEEA